MTFPNAGTRVLRVISFSVVLGAALTGSVFAGRHSTTTSTTSGDGYAYGRASEDGHSTFEYAIVQNDDNTNCSISGDDHWDVLNKLQKEVSTTKKDVFWFVKDD